MEQAGVALIAQGANAYFSDMKNATSATNAFVDATDKGSGRVSAAGQVIIGGLREIGKVTVDVFGKALKATAAFIGDSIGLAGDFEAQMLSFQAVAGKDVDTKGLEQFRDMFLDIGKRLPVSTADVQKAAIELVKGGIDPATIAAGGLESSIKFAAAAMDGDLVGAAEISAKIVGGWADVTATAAQKADLLTHSQDVLTKAANASTVGVQDLSLGLFNVQGNAKAAGMGLDETVQALALLSPNFSSAATAGTSLNAMITRLTPSTKPAIAAMSDLGLYTEETGSVFYDAQGSFIGWEQTAQILQDTIGGLTDVQKQERLETIFGIDAMGAAAELTRQGAAGWDQMTDALTRANGVAENAALKQQGFNTALDNAKGSVETLQIVLGTLLMPILTDLLNNYIAPGVNAVTAFAESFGEMIPAIAASDDPLQTFLNALKIAVPGLFDFIVAIEDIKDAAMPAVTEIMRLADAFGQGGIGGLIDAVVDDIQAALPDIEAQLGEWGQAFVDWVAPMIPPLLDTIGVLADEAWGWVKAQAPEWGNQLLAWGNELVEWIAPMIPPALVELGRLGDQFLGWIGDQAAPLLAKLKTWATSLVAWIVPATVTFLAEWPKMFDQFLDWVGDAAGPLLKQLGDWALSFIQWIAPMIPPFLVALGGVALAIGVWVIETAVVLTDKIINKWVPAIIGWIVTDAIPGLYKALESIWQVFQGWILDTERDLAVKMRDVGKSMIDGIKAGISNAWGSMVGWLSGKMSSLVDSALEAIGAGSPAVDFMPVGEFSVMGIMQGFSDTWPQLTALVSGLSDDLIDQVADIAEQISGVIADSFGATASIDRQIAKNLDSMKDVLPAYQQYATSALKGAQAEAEAFADPAEGAKYFQMRSRQILEYEKLRKDLADTQQSVGDTATAQAEEAAKADDLRAQLALATTDAEREAIQKKLDASQKAQDAMIAARHEAQAMIPILEKQMLLIYKAQEAERSQFNANKSASSNPYQDLIDQINQLFNNSKKADLEKQYAEAKTDAERERIKKLIEAAAIPVNDTGIGHDLQVLIQLLTKIFNVPGAAGGGPVDRGQPYWVGEDGPELFWPQTQGMVSPAASSAQMAARGNQTNYNGQVGNTYNMPVYTNNTQGAIQQSWAIMQASMP